MKLKIYIILVFLLLFVFVVGIISGGIINELIFKNYNINFSRMLFSSHPDLKWRAKNKTDGKTPSKRSEEHTSELQSR